MISQYLKTSSGIDNSVNGPASVSMFVITG